MRKFLGVLALPAALALSVDAHADVAGAAKAAIGATTVAARDSALAELDAAKANDPLAAYVAGSVEFFVALEKLGAGLHRHGFESPRSFMLPLMRLPVPDNPNPEPLTYEGFRQILSDFHDGMAKANTTLALVRTTALPAAGRGCTSVARWMSPVYAMELTCSTSPLVRAMQQSPRQTAWVLAAGLWQSTSPRPCWKRRWPRQLDAPSSLPRVMRSRCRTQMRVSIQSSAYSG